MKIKFFILFFLIVAAVQAQERIYYFGANGKIDAQNNMQTRISIKPKNRNKINVNNEYFSRGEWHVISRERWKQEDENSYRIKIQKGKKGNAFVRTYNKLDNGKWQFFDLDNQCIICKGITLKKVPLIFDGKVTRYYKSGAVKSEEIYRNNELIANKNWLENGIAYYDNLFYSVDRYPAYSRGNEQLNEAVFQKLKDNKVDFSRIDGQMLIGFVVFKDGKVGGFRVLKGITPHLDRLVVDALREVDGAWIPAQLNGENVRFFQKYPINFSHDEYQLEFFDLSSGLVQFERK